MNSISQVVTDRECAESNVAREYSLLRETVTSQFDGRVWFMTDACASVIASLMLVDLPNPIGLNLVDGPSSEKTTVLSFFYDLPQVYRSDSFTPASFVSQAAQVRESKLAKVDLLPRIRHKCLIVPELAPLFGADKEKLLENFSILTRVFDGEGLIRSGGVHGSRGYTGDYHFVWLGATTPIRPHVWKTMGNLGSRFLFLTAESGRTHEDDVSRAVDSILRDVPYREKLLACREAVSRFFEWLKGSLGNGQFERSIVWNNRAESEGLLRGIGELASVTAAARSTVSVWRTDDGGDIEVDFTVPIKEAPYRLFNVLYGLARGHALLSGRTRLTADDLPTVVGVALSSMPDDRRRVLDLMLSRGHPEKQTDLGQITSTEVREILGFSQPKARTIIDTLGVLKVGEVTRGSSHTPSKLELSPQFKWLLSDEFMRHREVWAQVTSPPGGTLF